MTIKALSDSVINKIAAGEVVERPSNVIKELLENALDAEADEIKIEIEDAGLTKIKISDNGKGMERDDLHLSYKRHTTSKIEKEEDLNQINSLGFRGEALASISEVSHIKIKTKTKENEVGYMIEIEGGIKLSDQKVGCSDGTIIEIQNLFYNVPARLKFLKSPEVELAHIHNNKEIINSQKTDSQLNNIIYIYGTEMAKNLVEIDHRKDKIKIEGYVSKPSLTRANKNEQSLYINGRYVKSQEISEAIYSAYNTLLFTNRHPIYILNLIINPAEIDVNVHPTKKEVRFRKPNQLRDVVVVALQKALTFHRSYKEL